jgi:hypothetical protein
MKDKALTGILEVFTGRHILGEDTFTGGESLYLETGDIYCET